MGVFDRIGEMTLSLFSGKKGIVLVVFIVIVAVGVWKYQFSGVQEEVVEEDVVIEGEEEYWNHLKKSDKLVSKAEKLSDEAGDALDKKDFDKAIELYTQDIELTKEARNLVLKAYNSTDDELLKQYAWYSAEQLRYVILWEETRVEGIKALKDGDLELSKKYLKEFEVYQNKAREMYEKRKEVKERYEKVGEWK